MLEKNLSPSSQEHILTSNNTKRTNTLQALLAGKCSQSSYGEQGRGTTDVAGYDKGHCSLE